jgi:hypothetical protein
VSLYKKLYSILLGRDRHSVNQASGKADVEGAGGAKMVKQRKGVLLVVCRSGAWVSREKSGGTYGVFIVEFWVNFISKRGLFCGSTSGMLPRYMQAGHGTSNRTFEHRWKCSD